MDASGSMHSINNRKMIRSRPERIDLDLGKGIDKDAN
jgi:hypothetical protein